MEAVSDVTGEGGVRGRNARAAAGLAFAIPLVIFLLGWRYLGSGDTEPAELLPVSVLEEGNLDFNEFIKGTDLPYPYRRVGQHVVSAYPILPGLLSIPVYAIARAAGTDIYSQRQSLSLLSASIIASLSVVFLFLALQTFSKSIVESLIFSFIYAFGTCVWSVASRGMWQHGPSLLCLTSAIWLLLSGRARQVVLAGVPVALAVLVRPSNAALVLPLMVYVAVRQRRQLPGFLICGSLPCLLLLLYSRAYLGTWLSLGQQFPSHSFDGNMWRGLTGLLLSPSRGVFVFSPVFLASLLGLVEVVRHSRDWPPLLPYLAVGSILLLVVYSPWGMWWGGTSFGYRLLIELIPGLTLFLIPAWRALFAKRTVLRVSFAALVVLSVSANALGAFIYPSEFNENINLETSRLWDFRHSELILCARRLLRLPPLSRPVVPTVWWTPENNDDSIPGWISDSPGTATVHGVLQVSGWAKSAAGDVEVRVILDDGRIASPERTPFPGLAKILPQLGDTSRAAFRTAFAPPRKPDWHVLAVEFRAPSGKVRRLGPIRFRWVPS